MKSGPVEFNFEHLLLSSLNSKNVKKYEPFTLLKGTIFIDLREISSEQHAKCVKK